jgi:hypothetical protein
VDSKFWFKEKLSHPHVLFAFGLLKINPFPFIPPENSNIVLNKERFFSTAIVISLSMKFYRLRSWLCQILNHKTEHPPLLHLPNVVCSGIKVILFHQIDDFLLAVSETCIIVILILSKLTTKILYKNLFP